MVIECLKVAIFYLKVQIFYIYVYNVWLGVSKEKFNFSIYCTNKSDQIKLITYSNFTQDHEK